LRGLREGWVHWFVGHPVVHPEDATVSMFDEAKGRFVPVPFDASGISKPDRRTPHSSCPMVPPSAAAATARARTGHDSAPGPRGPRAATVWGRRGSDSASMVRI
jgi:hypothetical protein